MQRRLSDCHNAMELFPSLQVHLGMIYSPGPRYREIPSGSFTHPQTFVDGPVPSIPPSFHYTGDNRIPLDETSLAPLVEIFRSSIQNRQVPVWTAKDVPTRRIAWNVEACTRSDVTVETLKSIIVSRKRIDVEQAVGLVFSLLGERAHQLVPLVPSICIGSSMWLSPAEAKTDKWKYRFDYLDRLYAKCNEGNLMPKDATYPNWSQLLQFLSRVRRKKTQISLSIPGWVYERAGFPPSQIADHQKQSSAPIPNPITISRRNFRRLFRYLRRFDISGNPELLFRDAIDRLEGEDSPLNRVGDLSIIRDATEPLALAYTFLAAQRALQLKVVSNYGASEFLAQGQGAKVQQNTPYISTSIEDAIAAMAMAIDEPDWEVLRAIRPPKGVERMGEDLAQKALAGIDRACELMEQYVFIYGSGQFEVLRPKPGRYGGFRGPVDSYNRLVDILRRSVALYQETRFGDASSIYTAATSASDFVDIKERPEEPPLVGKCRKFLALDIMSWNNSWGDDAFAEGFVPGWVGWLEKRRSEGALIRPERAVIIN